MLRARAKMSARLWIAAAAFVGTMLAVVVAASAAPESKAVQRVDKPSATVSKDLGTSDASAPEIRWKQCPDGTLPPGLPDPGYECSTVKVPLSYRKPGGRKIELALGRLPATGPERKIGTLFWNPGGPGGPGRIPPPFSPKLRERFDIVGFDPRGVGESTPLKCFTSNRQALNTFGRPFPITLQQEQRFFDANERGTRLCARNAGPLLWHMSTANVARDMDLLRQSVGDKKMTYIGYSYGTHLGEVYANLFPKKVRALALDAVLDPVEWTTGKKPGDALVKPFTYRLGSFDGAQKALRTFLRACADDNRCAFRERGSDARELEAKYERLLERLRNEPAEVSEGGQTFELTYQDVVGFTLSLLYSAEASPLLAEFLQDIYEVTEPQGERTTQGTTQERKEETVPEVDVPDVPTQPTFERPQSRQQQGPYFGLEWFPAVSCLDTENPNNKLLWSVFARKADQQAPGFGSLWTYSSMPCATWPVTDPDRYAGPWNKKTSGPILTIGNRQGDPATPYDDAQTTTQRLADARLLTLDSFGHTAAYGGQSRCIDRTVDRYLIEGKLPPEGKVCQPDRKPFDPVPAPFFEDSKPEDSVPPEPLPPRF